MLNRLKELFGLKQAEPPFPCFVSEESGLKVHPDHRFPKKVYEQLNFSHIKTVSEDDSQKPITPDKLRVVCISDTHNKTDDLIVPEGDVLIHSGDFTNYGLIDEIDKFNQFINSQPHKYKVIICGNHEFSFGIYDDWFFEHSVELGFVDKVKQQMEERGVSHPKELLTNCTYLQTQSCSIAGIKFYGTPTSAYINGWAYNLRRGEAALRHYDKIPADTDVLITHGPPLGIGDISHETQETEPQGCSELYQTVTERVKPKIHLFGHIHHSHGMYTDDTTLFINAASCNYNKTSLYTPICVDLDIPTGFTKSDFTMN